jgi:hypothetical protein
VSKIHGRFGIAGSAAVVLAESLFGLPAAADAATLPARAIVVGPVLLHTHTQVEMG